MDQIEVTIVVKDVKSARHQVSQQISFDPPIPMGSMASGAAKVAKGLQPKNLTRAETLGLVCMQAMENWIKEHYNV